MLGKAGSGGNGRQGNLSVFCANVPKITDNLAQVHIAETDRAEYNGFILFVYKVYKIKQEDVSWTFVILQTRGM